MTSITSWRRASQLVSTTRRQTTVSLTVWLPSHDSSCWRHAWRTNKRQWSHDASHVRYVTTTVSLTLMSHTPPTKQQHMLTIPPQIACASALPGKTGKYESCIFDPNAELLHCMNSTICLISSVIWLTTHTHAAVWLPTSMRSDRGCWGHGSG